MSFTPVRINDLLDGEASASSTSTLAFDTPTSTFKSKVSNLVSGPNTVYVFSADDLPPSILGIRKLAQNTTYVICNQIILSDDILIPAGWNGVIRSTFIPRNALVYTGVGTLFNTLNTFGTIISFADSVTEPGVKTTVTTSLTHGFINGDFLNITDTLIVPAYSGLAQQVSNVTATTFDIEVVFDVTDTGSYDTGFFAIQFFELACFATNPAASVLFDVIGSKDPDTVFAWDNFAAFNFAGLGNISDSATVSGTRGFMTFFSDGIRFTNCDTIGISDSNFTNVDPGDMSSMNIELVGNATRDVVISDVKFNVPNAAQFPMRISNGINNASITIRSSPDNGVATDYFDPAGRDQTDPQVIAISNAARPDSMFTGDVGLEIAAPITIPIVTQDVPVPITDVNWSSSNLERFEDDTLTLNQGRLVNKDLSPRKYSITYSATINRTGGGGVNVGIVLLKNGTVISINPPRVFTTTVTPLTRTEIIELDLDDVIQIAVINYSGVLDIDVYQANLSINRG